MELTAFFSPSFVIGALTLVLSVSWSFCTACWVWRCWGWHLRWTRVWCLLLSSTFYVAHLVVGGTWCWHSGHAGLSWGFPPKDIWAPFRTAVSLASGRRVMGGSSIFAWRWMSFSSAFLAFKTRALASALGRPVSARSLWKACPLFKWERLLWIFCNPFCVVCALEFIKHSA